MTYTYNDPASVPDDLKDWPGHTGNWGRWPNDRGTLNLLTPESTLRGIRAVRTGEVFTCARPVVGLSTLEKYPQPEGFDLGGMGDHIKSFDPHHGPTHIDGLGHIFFKGYGFNGYSIDEVFDETGTRKLSMMNEVGIVTRGVFVDVARRRGVDALADDDCVYVEDIADAAERLQPGDAFVVRLGPRRNLESVDPSAGFHYECVELIASKDAAVLASDSPSDRFPSATPEIAWAPIHTLAETFYGIPLIHDMDLQAVGETCAARGRDDFLFIASPPNIHGTTGQLVQPLIVL
ncbi:cyclase family protein [Actinosynnema sp. NPDC059335]|uniref:cyclase family protein n=1 Tax=Actinosynnema sp. NPDC059335 TaxID=3346804 RepID=UPI003671DE18